MAALTVNTTPSNGPVGIGERAFADPGEVFPVLKTICREIDFAKQSFAKNANYVFMPIPKGFLAKHIAVKQLDYIDAAVTVAFATKNADTKAIGGNFALVAEGNLLCSVQPADAAEGAPGHVYFAADDTLCLKLPSTADLTTGRVMVALIGAMPFGDSAEFGNGAEPMRTAADPGLDNTSSADYDD